MADIFGTLKKRFKGKRGKEQELAVDRTALEGLISLKARLASDPKSNHSSEFSNLVKEFFQKFLKLKYQFTYEELISEITKRRFTDGMKRELIDFLQDLTQLEYSPGGGISQTQLPIRMESFEDLVIKITSESAKPHKPQQASQEQAKPNKAGPAAAEPAEPSEKPEESVERPRHLFSLFRKKEPQIPEAPKPAPEPVQAILKKQLLPAAAGSQDSKMGDRLSDIYSLFNSAYDAVKKKKAVNARDILVKIRTLNSKLDRQSQSQFKEEIVHLNQEITLLQKELAEKARKDRGKAPELSPSLQPPQPPLLSKSSKLESRPAAKKPEPAKLLPPSPPLPQQKIPEPSALKTALKKPAKQLPPPPPPEIAPQNEKKPSPNIEKTEAFTLFRARSKAEKGPVEEPSPEEAKKIDVLKHPLKKKPFSYKPAAPIPEPKLEEELQVPEPVLPQLKAEQPPLPPKPAKAEKKKQPALPKTPPPPPHIPDLLEIEPLAPAPDQLPYPRKFTFAPQADTNQEIVHEPPRLENQAIEKAKEVGPIVEQIYEEIREQNKHAEEETLPEQSLVSRLLSSKHPSKKPASPAGLPPPPSLSPELPTQEPGIMPRTMPQTDKEQLTQISDLIRQMKGVLAAKDIAGAEGIWNQITEAGSALSPELSKKMGTIVQEISSALDTLKAEALSSEPIMAPLPDLPQIQEQVAEDHNEMISRVIRGTPGFMQPAQAEDFAEPAPKPTPKPTLKPAPKPKQPKLSRQELERQRATQALTDFNEALDSARNLLRTSQLDEAKDAYQRALMLKKRINVDEAERNRLTYELMDLNVALRMAEVR